MGSIITVRPLLPPPPQFGARLQPQHLHWQVGRYKERITSGPGGLGRGRLWAVDREGEQHNLILNAAYDILIGQGGFLNLHSYAAVGTGNTPPAATQTTLVNEVARTRRNEGGNTSGVYSIIYTGNPGVYDIQVTREFSEAEVGNRNLTEWGFSPSGTANATLMCRELFRDGSNTPIVITLASDQRLRLIYKIRVTLGPIQQNRSINISGLGNLTGVQKLHRYSYGGVTPNYNIDLILADNWSGGLQVDINVDDRPNPNWNYGDDAYGQGTNLLNKRVAADAYVANSRQRTLPAVLFAASEANFPIARLFINATPFTGANHALQFWFDSPFTKDNLHKLQFDQWTLTWGP
jgi:hypothetical protein